jgi:hypothetical protein
MGLIWPLWLMVRRSVCGDGAKDSLPIVLGALRGGGESIRRSTSSSGTFGHPTSTKRSSTDRSRFVAPSDWDRRQDAYSCEGDTSISTRESLCLWAMVGLVVVAADRQATKKLANTTRLVLLWDMLTARPPRRLIPWLLFGTVFVGLGDD